MGVNDIWHINDVDIRLCLTHLMFNYDASFSIWKMTSFQFICWCCCPTLLVSKKGFNAPINKFQLRLKIITKIWKVLTQRNWIGKSRNHAFVWLCSQIQSLATAFIFHVVSLIFLSNNTPITSKQRSWRNP